MLLLLAVLPAASAFRLSAHRAITDRAIAAEGMEELERWLWQGNRAEDTHLNVKWRHFSHYFRPDAALVLPRRGTSDERVVVLVAEAQAAQDAGDTAALWQAVGGILHHVQDMASPPHVVPVAHDLRDGFESWPVDALVAGLDLVPAVSLDPVAAHSALAWETWERVQSDKVSGCGVVLPLSEIWRAPASETFGTYGGIDFGDVGGCPELVSSYEGVLVNRLEAAVRSSRSVLQHYRSAP